MKIKVNCESCGGHFTARGEHAGRTGRCPRCGEAVIVPAAQDEREDVATSEADAEPLASTASVRWPQNPALATGAAVVAAVVGAGAWALVAIVTNLEAGYVAWGIGALIGLATVAFGGRHAMQAALAAVLALTSIVAGKMIGVHFLVRHEMVQGVEVVGRQMYDAFGKEAEALGENPSSQDLRVFLFHHGFSEAERWADVTDEEIRLFEEGAFPQFREFLPTPPPFEDWLDRNSDAIVAYAYGDLPLARIVIDNLDPTDIVFILLGIGTAWGIVARAYKRDRLEARKRRAEERRRGGRGSAGRSRLLASPSGEASRKRTRSARNAAPP